MRSLVGGVLSRAVPGGSAALAQVAIRKEPVHFQAGETGDPCAPTRWSSTRGMIRRLEPTGQAMLATHSSLSD